MTWGTPSAYECGGDGRIEPPEVAVEGVEPRDAGERCLHGEGDDQRSVPYADRRWISAGELIAQPVDPYAAHPCIVDLVLEADLVYSSGGIAVGEHGDHPPRLDVVSLKGYFAVADGGHDFAVAVQVSRSSAFGQKRHELDVGDRVVDPSAQSTIYMERSRAVRPSDLQCGQQVRIVFFGRQDDGAVISGRACAGDRIEIADDEIDVHPKLSGVVQTSISRNYKGISRYEWLLCVVFARAENHAGVGCAGHNRPV